MRFHSILPAVPMKGRRLTFAKYLTVYQALCMELLYTSWGKNRHPHFRDEGKWSSETLNSLPQKQQSQNQGWVVPALKTHIPQMYHCAAKCRVTARTWSERSGYLAYHLQWCPEDLLCSPKLWMRPAAASSALSNTKAEGNLMLPLHVTPFSRAVVLKGWSSDQQPQHNLRICYSQASSQTQKLWGWGPAILF